MRHDAGRGVVGHGRTHDLARMNARAVEYDFDSSDLLDPPYVKGQDMDKAFNPVPEPFTVFVQRKFAGMFRALPAAARANRVARTA